MAKKLTNAERIRRYLAKNPNATARQVIDEVGVKAPQAYHVMAQVKEAKAQAEGLADLVKMAGANASTTSKWKPLELLPVPKVKPPATTDVAETLKARGGNYGTFVGQSKLAQSLKRTIYGHAREKNTQFTDDQVEALDMICNKIGRIVNGNPNYADSWVDIAGYAKLVSDRLETGLIT
jgi:hypothetical protein